MVRGENAPKYFQIDALIEQFADQTNNLTWYDKHLTKYF